MPHPVLLLNDDRWMLRRLEMAIRQWGHVPIPYTKADNAIQTIKEGLIYHLALTDLDLAGSDSGVDLIRVSREYHPRTPILLWSFGAHSFPGTDAAWQFDHTTLPSSNEPTDEWHTQLKQTLISQWHANYAHTPAEQLKQHQIPDWGFSNGQVTKLAALKQYIDRLPSRS